MDRSHILFVCFINKGSAGFVPHMTIIRVVTNTDPKEAILQLHGMYNGRIASEILFELICTLSMSKIEALFSVYQIYQRCMIVIVIIESVCYRYANVQSNHLY